MKNKRLIIFLHFAGGNGNSLKGISDELENIDKLCLELPGRGKRIKEGLLDNIDEVIEDIFENAKNIILTYDEYFIFGHSMGSLLAYLLAHKIKKMNYPLPKHLFVAGRGGPLKQYKKDHTYLLPSIEFREMLREIGGCPEGVLDNDEIMNFFEPIIRSDFKLVENYIHNPEKPLDVPITGFYGADKDAKEEDMKLWEEETSMEFKLFQYPGNHFFIFNNAKKIAEEISEVVHC